MPQLLRKLPPAGPPRTYPDWLDPENAAAPTPEEIRASLRALPIREVPPALGAPGYDPNITPSGGPVILPSTTEPPMIGGPPVPAPSLAPTGEQVADEYEQGLRVTPTKQPFGFRHPIMAAIGRGFEKAMPIIAGAAEGMAAGAYEPMAGAALGKGFLAAETRPYQKMKLQTDIAKRLQDLELSRAHADYYRALAPSVEEKVQIQRDRAAAYTMSQQARAEYNKRWNELRAIRNEIQQGHYNEEDKARWIAALSTKTRNEAYAKVQQARLDAGEFPETVHRMRAQAEQMEATGELRRIDAETEQELRESQIERNRAAAQASRAGAGAMGGLSAMRQEQIATHRAASHILQDTVAKGGTIEDAIDNAQRYYQGDQEVEPRRTAIIEELHKARGRGAMTQSQYETRKTAIRSGFYANEEQRKADLEELETAARDAGLRVQGAQAGGAPAKKQADPLGIR